MTPTMFYLGLSLAFSFFCALQAYVIAGVEKRENNPLEQAFVVFLISGIISGVFSIFMIQTFGIIEL